MPVSVKGKKLILESLTLLLLSAFLQSVLSMGSRLIF